MRREYLGRVPLNTVVTVPGLGIEARVVKSNDCRVYVRILGSPKLVEFEGRSFMADTGRFDNWSPMTIVEVE